MCVSGLGSSTVDQVLKYPKYKPNTSTGQVLIFFRKYLSTPSTFISSTSTHIKIIHWSLISIPWYIYVVCIKLKERDFSQTVSLF